MSPASPVSYSFDDKDLDDDALWAVIDSAEASHSSSKPRKYPKFQSPSPPPPPPPRRSHFNNKPPNYDPYHRAHKIARFSASSSEVSEVSPVALEMEEKDAVTMHCLNGRFPTVSLFKDYQNAAMAILEKSDFTMISGNPFIKKSGWRKISFYFNISYEIKDKTIEFDDNRNVQRSEFVVRAYMQGGRFSDGWGSCDRREKRFNKPNHDVPSTAETRAKNKACQVWLTPYCFHESLAPLAKLYWSNVVNKL
ncbi:PEPTIDE TRANSPORTER FAMILY PROTEIN [Salix viminalis]|uniref:PEPTIDE TRANSPORTER FAMILY PROTEIN n=1 Tax=Salix viminalis TaxID=40686 RepID=A0A9Q0V4T4_SALVM|nr:PEPTIDE TRANSPORTER FAMILY PROTEIN [Salix viminalis]